MKISYFVLIMVFVFTSVIAVQADTLTFYLCPGLNLISIPLELEISIIDSIFPASTDLFTIDSLGFLIGPLDREGEVKPNAGYWVEVDTHTRMVFEGECVESWQIDVVRGWNLVGSLCRDIPLDSIQTSPPRILDTAIVYWFNNCMGIYLEFDYLGSGLGNMLQFSAPGILSVGVIDHIYEGVDNKPVFSIHTYPNPFNSQINIEYQLPQPGNIKIEIYDLTSRKVTMLLDKYDNSGYNNVTWDGDDYEGKLVNSGIYLIRVNYNENSITKRVVYLK